jgi:hypothetical protein
MVGIDKHIITLDTVHHLEFFQTTFQKLDLFSTSYIREEWFLLSGAHCKEQVSITELLPVSTDLRIALSDRPN